MPSVEEKKRGASDDRGSTPHYSSPGSIPRKRHRRVSHSVCSLHLRCHMVELVASLADLFLQAVPTLPELPFSVSTPPELAREPCAETRVTGTIRIWCWRCRGRWGNAMRFLHLRCHMVELVASLADLFLQAVPTLPELPFSVSTPPELAREPCAETRVTGTIRIWCWRCRGRWGNAMRFLHLRCHMVELVASLADLFLQAVPTLPELPFSVSTPPELAREPCAETRVTGTIRIWCWRCRGRWGNAMRSLHLRCHMVELVASLADLFLQAVPTLPELPFSVSTPPELAREPCAETRVTGDFRGRWYENRTNMI